MAGNYERVELIGSGTFGRAWLVKSKVNNRKYVIKEIKVSGMSTKDRDQAITEVTVLARCKHVNVIRYREAFLDGGMLNIAMEFADCGDLNKRIQDQKGQYFTEQMILDWFVQMCFGLRYIHKQNIIHRDLKTHNIFLALNNIIKIGDFGISRILEDAQDHANTAIGTPYYLSPEICQRQPYNHKSDMWAAGCVLYEMCTLKYAFQGENFTSLVLQIMEGKYDPIPSHFCPLLQDLIRVLLRLKADARPSAEQVLIVPSIQPYVQTYIRRQNKHRVIRSNSASPHMTRKRPSEDKENVPPKEMVNQDKARKYSLATPKTEQVFSHHKISSSAEPNRSKREVFRQKAPKLCLQKSIIENRRTKDNPRQKEHFENRDSISHLRLPHDLMQHISNHEETSSSGVSENVSSSPSAHSSKFLDPPRPISSLATESGTQTGVRAASGNRQKDDAISSCTYKVVGCAWASKKTVPSSVQDSTCSATAEDDGFKTIKMLMDTFPVDSEKLFGQMETLRFCLEQEMGVISLLEMYRALQQAVEGSRENCLSDALKTANWRKMRFFPAVYHLLVLEYFACHM